MTDQKLIQKIVILTQEERRIGVEILELLSEIEIRKAYSDLGYDGLFSFCVKHLKYSEAQAYRRIQAMRAMREIPELKSKIHSGELTVTTVSQVQSFIRNQEISASCDGQKAGEKRTKIEKLELFASFANQSSKVVQEKLLELKGEEKKIILKLELTDEIHEMWTQVKNQSAHQTRGQDERILKLLLESWLKSKKTTQTSSELQRTSSCLAEVPGTEVPNAKVPSTEVPNDKVSNTEVLNAKSPNTEGPSAKFSRRANTSQFKSQVSRYVPVQTKRAVWARDQGKCQQCASKYKLQIDHRIPHASDGSNELNNLRLLCQSCNLRLGIKVFGLSKMKRTHSNEEKNGIH